MALLGVEDVGRAPDRAAGARQRGMHLPRPGGQGGPHRHRPDLRRDAAVAGHQPHPQQARCGRPARGARGPHRSGSPVPAEPSAAGNGSAQPTRPAGPPATQESQRPDPTTKPGDMPRPIRLSQREASRPTSGVLPMPRTASPGATGAPAVPLPVRRVVLLLGVIAAVVGLPGTAQAAVRHGQRGRPGHAGGRGAGDGRPRRRPRAPSAGVPAGRARRCDGRWPGSRARPGASARCPASAISAACSGSARPGPAA